MPKPSITNAKVIDILNHGVIDPEDIAKRLGYGGKTGVVSKQTIAKIVAIIAIIAEIPKTEATTSEVVKAKAPMQDKHIPLKQVKAGNPFGNSMGANSLHHSLFVATSDKERSMDEAVTLGVSLTKRHPSTVRTFLNALSNPNDRHNNGRSINVAKIVGNIRLAAHA